MIALTGHALAGHSKVAFEAGCDAFVTKPCLPDVLLQEVTRMIREGETGASPPSSSGKSRSGR